jgi:hypothetical protein
MASSLLRWTRLAVAGSAVLFGVIACTPAAPPPNPDNTNRDNGDDDDDKSTPKPTGGDTTPTPPTTNMTLTKIDPPSVGIGAAPTGLQVTLTGTNFASGARVSIAGNLTQATFVDAQTLRVMVPGDKLAVQGNVPIAVVSATDARTNELSLAVGTGTGTGGLISLNPTGSPLGVQSVVIQVTGSAFDTTSVVVFDNSDVSTQLVNATTLRAVVPGFLLRGAGQVNVAVRKGGVLTSPLPFSVGGTGGNGGFCQMSCQEVGLFPGECASSGGGFPFDFFGIDFGGLFGSKVQCGFDGCIHDGCN